MFVRASPRHRRCWRIRTYTTLRRSNLPPPTDKFNILFCGNDEFSCIVLRALVAASDIWREIHVVTNQDRKHGRNGYKLQISPVKTLATTLELPMSLLPDKHALKNWLHSSQHGPMPIAMKSPLDPSSILVTASFGHIIPKLLLSRFFKSRRFNVHPSLLPQFRGPAPIQHAIASGSSNTGVSIIGIEPISKGLDVGDIWAQKQVPISAGSTFSDMHDTLAHLGTRLLVDVLRKVLAGTAGSFPQPSSGVTYAPIINLHSASVDFNQWDANRIERAHRAMGHQRALHISSHALGQDLLQIKEFSVRVPPKNLTKALREPGDAIYDIATHSLTIRCANDTEISVSKVKQEGRNLLPVREWWNGLDIERRKALRFGASDAHTINEV